jgi:hypothetical protein
MSTCSTSEHVGWTVLVVDRSPHRVLPSRHKSHRMANRADALSSEERWLQPFHLKCYSLVKVQDMECTGVCSRARVEVY